MNMESTITMAGTETGQKNISFTNEQKIVIRKKIIEIARSQLGKPYVWGAKVLAVENNPKAFDCSGFTKWCYNKAGLKLPDGASNQFDYTTSINVPMIGDLGFFRNSKGIYHVGILGEINMIEARGLQSDGIGGKVIERPVKNWIEFKKFAGWRSHNYLI